MLGKVRLRAELSPKRAPYACQDSAFSIFGENTKEQRRDCGRRVNITNTHNTLQLACLAGRRHIVGVVKNRALHH